MGISGPSGQLGKGLATGIISMLALAQPAFAASNSNNLNVKLAVNAACVITATDINFGTLSTVTGAETATSFVKVVCPPNTQVSVDFAPVFSVANTSKADVMKDPAGDTIGFNMALAGYYGNMGNFSYLWTNINAQLIARPYPPAGVYNAVEAIYVIY